MAKSENFNLSQSRSGNNELIFVKLTDSALREIEEYVKNQNKSGSNKNLSIQFSGTEGCLLFPPTASHIQGTKYSFTIADYEGPQGAFECLQQQQGQLEILGTLPHKLRIHANEDVYEATKHRMAVVQENQSSKCTREIKPGSTSDIGRKVRLKSQFPRIPNIPSTNSIQPAQTAVKQQQRDYNSSLSNSISNQSTSTSISSTTASSLNNHNSNISLSNSNSNLSQLHNVPTSSTTTTTTAAPTTLNNTISNNHSSNHNNASNTSSSQSSRITQGNGSGNTLPTRAPTHQPRKSKEQDISKWNIRVRLIHLLALRPYKKPELYARINGEGVKDREKNCIATVLKQISSMQGNTFHLNRHIWNDVHEDWPFYSEQERQSLKRRKPQNLTPPLSSDGGSSSTSGQSPTSIHNGSPPPAVKRPALKNDAFDGPVPKKTRVSHYKKEVNHDNVRKGVTDSRDTINMNPRSRELIEDIRPSIYDQFRSRPTNNHANAQEADESGMSLSYSVLGSDVAKRISNASVFVAESVPSRERERVESTDCGSTGMQSIEHEDNNSHRSSNNNNNHRNNHHNTSRDYERDISYDRELNGARESTRNLMNVGDIVGNDLSEFTRILSVEQRRKYKTEFDQDYQEYRELHTMMEGVSQKFTMLEDRLRQVSNNERQYRDIQREIVTEYRNNTNNMQFQEKKRKFHYLHQKLSHIKKLVQDFDATLKNNFQQQQQPLAKPPRSTNY